MSTEDKTPMDHLYSVLLRESKIILANYEKYLRDKITSKELAQKMLSLRDIIIRIEEQNK